MAGRGALDTVGNTNDRILMLDSLNRWIVAKDPVHFDKPKGAGVGPAISFAQEMLATDSHTRVGLIPCAWGGSPIKVWQPGGEYFKSHPYDDALSRARIAAQKGVLKGILWHQGESDNDSTHAAVYLQKLKELVVRLRTDLHQPDLPFVAGEIGYFNKVNYINPVVALLPKQLPFTTVVSAQGLEHKGDQLHFNSASARLLGKRYAEAMNALKR